MKLNNWAGFQGNSISEVERMGQMEDLKVSLTYNFQGKKNHFISVKLIVAQNFPQLSCNSSASPVFYTTSLKNIDTDCTFFFLILELVTTIHDMSCDTYYAHLPIKTQCY